RARRAALGHGPGPRHPDLARGGAAAATPVAALAAGGRRRAVVPGRDSLCGARLLAALPVDPGAAAARLPPLRGRVGRDGERGEALQSVGLPRGPVCEAVRRVLR